jgi:putative transposase
MKGSRFCQQQIIGILRKHDAGATLHEWKGRVWGHEVSEARRLKSPEDENRRLKTLLAKPCWTTRGSGTCSEKG